MAFGIDDAIFLGLGAANAGLGIMGAGAQNAAEQQAYKDQVKFQKANEAFARWQAKFNKKLTDSQNKFNYWGQVVSYNQQRSYVNSLRNFETAKAVQQAENVFKTRVAATSNYIQQSQALNQQIQEKGMQDALALQQYRLQSMRFSSAVQAMEKEGRSVDRLINDYARQEGDFTTIQQINRQLYNRQMTREQASAATRYIQAYNSQQFYKEQPYMDPLPPYAPLPTLIMPPPPSMTGAPPSNAALGINIATSVLSGANTAVSVYNSNALSSLRGGGGSPSVPNPFANTTGIAFSGINLLN